MATAPYLRYIINIMVPINPTRALNRFILRHRLLLFLITLISIIILFPFIHDIFTDYLIIMEILITMLLIFGVYIVSVNKQLVMVAILVATLSFTIIWFNIFIQSKPLLIFALILEIIFFIITTVSIISHVLTYKRVTADKIYGAICGYLLLGIIWTLIYITLETANPNAFQLSNSSLNQYDFLNTHRYYFTDFMYYSFVTISTLGYGDIIPLSSPARLLSALEAIVGQLYVAVLIARLVGLHISHSHFLDQFKDKE